LKTTESEKASTNVRTEVLISCFGCEEANIFADFRQKREFARNTIGADRKTLTNPKQNSGEPTIHKILWECTWKFMKTRMDS